MKRITVNKILTTVLGSTASVAVGDAKDNKYWCYFTVNVLGWSSLEIKGYIDDIFNTQTNINSTGTFHLVPITDKTSSILKLKLTTIGATTDVTFDYVEYEPEPVAPNPPTLTASYANTNPARMINVIFTTPSHPYTITVRQLEFYRVVGGITITKDAVEGSGTYGNFSPYETYKIRGRVQDSNNKWSDWSGWVTHTLRSMPTTPVGSIGTVTISSAVLNGNAFANADGGTHKSSMWIVQQGPTWQNFYNSGETSTYKLTITASGLAADTDYRWKVLYCSSYGAWSEASSFVYFSTATATAKRHYGGVRIKGTISKSHYGGVIIIPDPDIKQHYGGVRIAARYSVKHYGGVIIKSNPWYRDVIAPSTSWSSI